MGLTLKPYFDMRRDRNRVVLFSRRRSDFKELYFITPLAALVLSLLDGKRALADVSNIIRIVFDQSDNTYADELVQRVVTQYRKLLVESSSPTPQRFNPQEFLFKQHGPLDSNIRLERPIDLGIALLYSCNRRCRYCYVGAYYAATTSHIKERLMSFSDIVTVLEQANQLGVITLTLTGGEPFLHPDIDSILNYLKSTSFEIEISTKSRISPRMASILASMTNLHLQFSLDSHIPEIGNYLTGDSNYFDDALETLRIAAEYDLQIETNTVLTAHNINNIQELIEFLLHHGVRKMSFTPYYTRHFGRRSDGLMPDNENLLIRLPQLLSDLQNHYGDQAQIYTEIATEYNPNQLTLTCSAGRTGLMILPDGTVTLCDRLPRNHPSFKIGRVPTQSLKDIWDSQKILNLIAPSPELFEGTRCYRCLLFDECNTRGRCYVESFKDYRRTYAPDRTCMLNLPEQKENAS